jgi:hypothetical protein
MPLAFTSMMSGEIQNSFIFVSASIPDSERWNGDFDALEITDAVVALARAALTAGFRIVTAAHPTIAPLLLYVAAEFPKESEERVSVYQSELFVNVLPAATRRFEADGVGRLIWTAAAEGDRPIPGEWDDSLLVMRQRMLGETEPIAACFIGGMEGIRSEYELYRTIFPGRPTYPVGRPGGESRVLIETIDTPLRERLENDDVYPALWRAVIQDLREPVI